MSVMFHCPNISLAVWPVWLSW